MLKATSTDVFNLNLNHFEGMYFEIYDLSLAIFEVSVGQMI
jgi:hypothetical protein